MDKRTDPCPAVDPPETQPTLLDQDWRAIEGRHDGAQLAEAARVNELKQAEEEDAVDDPDALKDVALSFATQPDAALTF